MMGNSVLFGASVLCLLLGCVLSQAPIQAKPKDIDISNVRIRVAEEDTGSDWDANNFQTIVYPSGKIATKLSASDYQRVQISFQILEKGSQTHLTPHQTFVVFSGPQGREVILIPELDTKSNTYRLDADLKTKGAKLFEHISGTYKIDLIIGDVKINSVQWSLGDIAMSFPADEQSHVDYYAVQPEIVHMFRQPEKRPPEFVSNVFCLVLGGLFVVMLLLWLRVGLNFSGITVSGLLFQASLAAIFYVEIQFYLGNNMFDTVRYLSYVSPFALYFGRRMLAHKSRLEEGDN